MENSYNYKPNVDYWGRLVPDNVDPDLWVKLDDYQVLDAVLDSYREEDEHEVEKD